MQKAISDYFPLMSHSWCFFLVSNWIDAETKQRSLKKSRMMKSLIGFPEWILNKTQLEKHYEGVSKIDIKSRKSCIWSEIIFIIFLSTTASCCNNTRCMILQVKIKSETWMENIVELLGWQFMEKLTTFRMRNKVDWAATPSNVNAFHTFQSNAISKSREKLTNFLFIFPLSLSLISHSVCNFTISLL